MLGSPDAGAILKWYAVRRPIKSKTGTLNQWLICNGMMMGRWTLHFGANCLADMSDNISFAKSMIEQIPDAEMVEVEVNCTFKPGE